MKAKNITIAFVLRFWRVAVATALFIALIMTLIIGISANDLILKVISVVGLTIWIFGVVVVFDIGPVDDQGDIWDD